MQLGNILKLGYGAVHDAFHFYAIDDKWQGSKIVAEMLYFSG